MLGSMADKFEREIEEILAKLDDELPTNVGPGQDCPARSPISLTQKRKQKAKADRVRTKRTNPLPQLSPTNLLFAGAGVMFAGLIVSGFWGPAIWASLAGIVLFIAAFFWSFRRTAGGGGTPSSQGHFWRGRWIDDTQPGATTSGVKSWFRRK